MQHARKVAGTRSGGDELARPARHRRARGRRSGRRHADEVRQQEIDDRSRSGNRPRDDSKFTDHGKNIAASGISCTGAFKFVNNVYNNHTSTTPEHFKCTNGHFKAPLGYFAEECTRKGVKIQYAGQGG